MEPKLTIELVPKTCWYTNVRSNVSRSRWDEIRKKCYQEANYKCEVCGGVGPKHPVECHEIWEYDDENHKQTLTGLISLCPDCHMCKHPGLANIKGKAHLVLQHLAHVNETTPEEAADLLTAAFEKWRERSQYEWELDISLIDTY